MEILNEYKCVSEYAYTVNNSNKLSKNCNIYLVSLMGYAPINAKDNQTS